MSYVNLANPVRDIIDGLLTLALGESRPDVRAEAASKMVKAALRTAIAVAGIWAIGSKASSLGIVAASGVVISLPSVAIAIGYCLGSVACATLYKAVVTKSLATLAMGLVCLQCARFTLEHHDAEVLSKPDFLPLGLGENYVIQPLADRVYKYAYGKQPAQYGGERW